MGRGDEDNCKEQDKIIWEQIKQIKNITDINRKRLFNLIKKHRKLFSDKPGRIKGYEHEIKLKNKKAFVKRNYPVPLSKRPKVRDKIQKLKDENIIEDSIGDFCSPLRIVEKSDGNIRVCLDGRFINEVIHSETDAPPEISDILQKFEGKKFFTITDLTLGYLQIPLTKESRKYTAFVFDGKAYQFKRIPFGLKTVSNGFIRAINSIIGSEFADFVTIYVDDIVIASETFEEHIEHLDRLFMRLQDA